MKNYTITVNGTVYDVTCGRGEQALQHRQQQVHQRLLLRQKQEGEK